MEQSRTHLSLEGLSSTQLLNIASETGTSAWGGSAAFNSYHGSSDASFFSSSLPVLPHEKLNLTASQHEHQSVADASSKLEKLAEDEDIKGSIGNIDLSGFGIMLPDDEEELLAGISDGFDINGFPNQVDDIEDGDIFGSGGGMELDFDPLENLSVGLAKTNINDGYSTNGSVQYSVTNGEHPYGEHPSRTLFVRNINSNVEDSELRSLFEQYGDIRTLYTACKHRGFVMISYYDIRAARTAMRALQNKPVRRRKLDIHFSIPKENPPEKDINQGTLVVFNLDPSVTNDDLRQIFGAYGEVKEIRETPHKRHHKFIEYYDVRAAEAALRSLNRSDIAGKRIKLEPSRPGGARRNLFQQLNHDGELDDARSYRHQVGSPMANSPPGSWARFSSPTDNSPLRSPTFGAGVPAINNHMPSSLPPMMSNSLNIAPIGRDRNRTNQASQMFFSSSSNRGVPFQHSHSFPEHSESVPNMSSRSGDMSSFGPLTSGASGVGSMLRSQLLWGGPVSYSKPQSSAWPASSMGHSYTSNRHDLGTSYSGLGSFSGSTHHVGSAPSGVPYDRHRNFQYFPESSESSPMSQAAFGSMGIGRNDESFFSRIGSQGRYGNPGITLSRNIPENVSPGFRTTSPRLEHMFPSSTSFTGSGFAGMEGLFESGRSHKVYNDMGQFDSKRSFQLDLEKIVRGEDTRTTLMIKNIPNKYTSKMLLAAIDESHKGTYDFLYLPIDFKNKCNVGYAFINMVSPLHIVAFYEDFNGRKWEKFNSEKVACLAYARIQGKAALISHFQNSSLMNEDKRCRPILFNNDGQEVLDQELFLSNDLDVRMRQHNGGDLPEGPKSGEPGEKSDKASISGTGSREE